MHPNFQPAISGIAGPQPRQSFDERLACARLAARRGDRQVLN
jgi:hypothetical protein